MQREFIFADPPSPACHASTIAETAGGLIVAWFGGKREGARDVGIWLARRRAGGWSEPTLIATGSDRGRRYPCWNPVLFQPRSGPLYLYYKVGPRPSRWWGMQMVSTDHGESWSEPVRLARGILGPIKNKPIELASGVWLSPSSCERSRWRIHIERSDDQGASWHRGAPLNDGRHFAAIQPCLLAYGEARLQLLCRTRQGVIASSWSSDGRHWSPLADLSLPNPDSGIDAVSLSTGVSLLVYNHTPTARTPLNLAVSTDGHVWQPVRILEHEPGEFSYPAVIEGADGAVHLTYTWNRRTIRYLRLEAGELAPEAMAGTSLLADAAAPLPRA